MLHAEYRHLHAHPELSMQEHETAAWIEARLDELGVPHERVGGTGVVGILRHPEGAEGPVVAWRADSDGLWERVPRPVAVLGQHVMPARTGTVRYVSGDAMSLADSFRVTFHGKGAHGSMPERSIDPILMASSAVTRLQGIVSREVAPTDRAVVTVGTFHAGVKENIIPDTAEIALNVRTPTPEAREKVSASIERILTAEALASGAPADAIDVPLVYWFLGGFEGEDFGDNPANHTPRFGPVMEPTLTTGVHAALAGLLHYVGR